MYQLKNKHKWYNIKFQRQKHKMRISVNENDF